VRSVSKHSYSAAMSRTISRAPNSSVRSRQLHTQPFQQRGQTPGLGLAGIVCLDETPAVDAIFLAALAVG